MNTNLLLNINPQAWAVLHGVVYNGEEYPDVDAYAWYNGRERGIVLAKSIAPANCLYVAFAENCRSDHIVVYSWKGGRGVNPPTTQDVPDDAWEERRHFPFFRVDQAVKYILKLLERN